MNTPYTFRQTCLQYRLEQQSQEIETVLRRYTAPGTAVTSGQVISTAIHYHVRLDAPLPPRDYRAALGQLLNSEVTVSAVSPTTCTVTVPRPQPPVSLVELLLTYTPKTAVLGLDSAGGTVPFLLPANGHVLITGQPGSGKTSLLQTLAVTLALAQPNQFVVIQGQGNDELNALNHLPSAYRLAPVLVDHTQVAQTLTDLAGHRAGRLPIVLLIDDVEHLWATGGTAVLFPLLHLLQNPNIHLIVTTAQPENDLLGYLAELFTVRLTGKTADTAHTPAGQLLGQGDFLLSGANTLHTCYFQAAYADRYEISFLLGQLPAPAMPPQLANWRNGRVGIPPMVNV